MLPALISTICELIIEISHATIHHAKSLWTLYTGLVQLKWVIPSSLLRPWDWILGREGVDMTLELSRPQVFTVLLGK